MMSGAGGRTERIMKIFADLLAGWALTVAVLAVGGGYLMKTGWLPQVHTRFTNFQITSGLILAVLLLSLARCARYLERNRSRVRLAVCSLGILIMALSGGLLFQSFYRILSRPALVDTWTRQANTKYTFNSDWVSRNIDEWFKVLEPYRGQPNVRAIEIGAFEGRASIWFLENILTDPSASLTVIDLFSEDYTGYGNFRSYEKIFDRNIALAGAASKVIKMKGDSRVVLRSLPTGEYDFVYIDGSHIAKDVMVDAVLSWELLKPAGILIFDDYRTRGAPDHPQGPAYFPQLAIDAFLKVYQPYIDVLHKDYQVIIKRRDSVNLSSQKYTIYERFKNLLY